MAHSNDHDHTIADESHVVQYKRTVQDGETIDSGRQVDRGDLAAPLQQYIDHAGRPTTVKEYSSGRVDVFVGDDQRKYWAQNNRAAKERLIDQANALASSTEWKAAGDQFRRLVEEWKTIGHVDRATDDALWNQFNGARQTFNSRRQTYFAERDKAAAAAASAKERIASRAVSVASSNDLKAAGDEMKRLLDEWKQAGRADKATEDRLWARFDNARKQLNERRSREFEKRKAEWASNKSAKEQLVREAESLVHSVDMKAAGERMRSLSDRWKQIGPCDKADNDQLWRRFNTARNALNDRRTREFEKRKTEWANNRAAKERIAAHAEALASSSDLRAAGDAMRALSEEWKRIGPCEKADNQRLWDRFNAARTRLRDRKQQDFEARKADRRRKAQDYVSRLEDQLYRTEGSIARAQEAYSRALSARSPSMSNPNWYKISMSQQERQANARERLTSLQMRRSEIVNKLSAARAQLSSL